MATRITSPDSLPSRALTLDQAYERAWRRLHTFLAALAKHDDAIGDGLVKQLAWTSTELTKDLIDAGVGGALAYQLARPRPPE